MSLCEALRGGCGCFRSLLGLCGALSGFYAALKALNLAIKPSIFVFF